jgi:hypothetical protein
VEAPRPRRLTYLPHTFGSSLTFFRARPLPYLNTTSRPTFYCLFSFLPKQHTFAGPSPTDAARSLPPQHEVKRSEGALLSLCSLVFLIASASARPRGVDPVLEDKGVDSYFLRPGQERTGTRSLSAIAAPRTRPCRSSTNKIPSEPRTSSSASIGSFAIFVDEEE